MFIRRGQPHLSYRPTKSPAKASPERKQAHQGAMAFLTETRLYPRPADMNDMNKCWEDLCARDTGHGLPHTRSLVRRIVNRLQVLKKSPLEDDDTTITHVESVGAFVIAVWASDGSMYTFPVWSLWAQAPLSLTRDKKAMEETHAISIDFWELLKIAEGDVGDASQVGNDEVSEMLRAMSASDQ